MTVLGTSIRIFLADGTPDGLRLVEKANWTGLALVGPKSIYADVRKREEFDRPGVYVLRGTEDDNPSRTKLYVGEADVVRARLDLHVKQKEWWNDFIVFTSKDENLNKAYIRHLESRLVEIAVGLKRVSLDNGNAPQRPRLSEADEADAEGFLANMRLIYPVLGIHAFEEPREQPTGATTRPLLHLRGKDTTATGRDLAEGFVVYAGSVGRADAVQSIHGYLKDWRRQLLEDGVFVIDQGALRLTQDFTFSSPSMAAGVLLGRSSNGRVEWHDDQGRTLKDIQESALTATGFEA